MFKKRSAVAFFAVVATTAAFAPAVWAQSVYVVGSPGANPTAPFGTLDIATGAFTALGTVNRQFATLAFAPDGALYGTDFSRNLYRINTANGATTFIGSTGTTFLIGLAATGNGTVFGMTNAAPSGQLYTVDTTTAALTVRGGSFGNAPDKGDNLEFGLGGTLYAAGDDAQGRFALYAANALTGAGTLIGGDTAFFDVRGLTWTGGSLLYGFNNASILTIDTATGDVTDTGRRNSANFLILSAAFPVAGAVAVPEPGSLALFALAAFPALLAVRRRQRKQTQNPDRAADAEGSRFQRNNS